LQRLHDGAECYSLSTKLLPVLLLICFNCDKYSAANARALGCTFHAPGINDQVPLILQGARRTLCRYEQLVYVHALCNVEEHVGAWWLSATSSAVRQHV
jgi:hypothetical protein